MGCRSQSDGEGAGTDKLMSMRTGLYLVAITLVAQNIVAQSSDPALNSTDVEAIVGDWSGQLIYRDYSSGKEVSIPCNVSVGKRANGRKIILEYTYPNEPKANRKARLKLSRDGRFINRRKLTHRADTANGCTVTMAYDGKDGNEKKAAKIQEVFVLESTSLRIRKEVRFLDSDEWLLRNEYAFTR